jgi:hypothetical protein
VLRATGRLGADTVNYRAMLKVARQWPDRVWAVEGAAGSGRSVARRLLADGKTGRVLDVPGLAADPGASDVILVRCVKTKLPRLLRRVTSVGLLPATPPRPWRPGT